ncbi:MAG TPA: type II secretion system F family protein [Candidatus Paceibacterota bacterium]|jgi:type IV pilus assembly protein PilC|nr:type II secretion system F family protein [Candidatus Paceibacterota bacterium]
MAHEKDFFLENFSLLLRAGMPATEALSTLKEELRRGSMRRTVEAVEEEVISGGTISVALSRGKLLSPRFISLLRVGEETGQFAEQLTLVIAERKKEELFAGKIRSALIYPGFVLAVTFFVGLTVMWYVFPKLSAVFASSGGTLPLTTRAIISIGNFFSLYGTVVVPAALMILAALFFFLFVYSKTRSTGEWLLLHSPISKSVIQEIELARFGYILGTLLRAGIPIPQALESLRDSTSFVLYKRFYQSIMSHIDEGQSLYRSIEAIPHVSTYMPPHIARLLLAGELSGALSDTLLRVSEEYDRKLDTLTQNLSALLEPVIIVVVGLIVAVIALGVISPIYGLVNQIQ